MLIKKEGRKAALQTSLPFVFFSALSFFFVWRVRALFPTSLFSYLFFVFFADFKNLVFQRLAFFLVIMNKKPIVFVIFHKKLSFAFFCNFAFSKLFPFFYIVNKLLCHWRFFSVFWLLRFYL